MFTTGGEERSGMGFTIMESFMDRLRVTSVPAARGTTVTMRSARSPRAAQRDASSTELYALLDPRAQQRRPARRERLVLTENSGPDLDASRGATSAAAWRRTTSTSSAASALSKAVTGFDLQLRDAVFDLCRAEDRRGDPALPARRWGREGRAGRSASGPQTL